MSWFVKLFWKKNRDEKSAGASQEQAPRPAESFILPGVSDLTADKEHGMINWLAAQIVGRGLETPAILFFESVKPISSIGSQLALMPAAPFLELFGIRGYDWAILFNKRQNVELLLQKIEELARNSSKKA